MLGEGPAVLSSSTTAAATNVTTYVIKPNETWAASRNPMVSRSTTSKWLNHITIPGKIRAGQIIKIPSGGGHQVGVAAPPYRRTRIRPRSAPAPPARPGGSAFLLARRTKTPLPIGCRSRFGSDRQSCPRPAVDPVGFVGRARLSASRTAARRKSVSHLQTARLMTSPARPPVSRALAFCVTPAAVIVVCACALVAFGLTVLFSASAAIKKGPFLLPRQAGRSGPDGAAVTALGVSRVDLEWVRRRVWWVAGRGSSPSFLVLVPGLGVAVKGSRRWLGHGRCASRSRRSPRSRWCSASRIIWR